MRSARDIQLHFVRFNFNSIVNGGSKEIFSLLTERNHLGEALFSNSSDLIRAVSHFTSHRDRFVSCWKALDRWGNPVFRHGDELIDYLDTGKGPRRAVALANLSSSAKSVSQNLGERSLTGFDIAMLCEARFSYRECIDIVRANIDPMQQIYLRRLKRSTADFSNDGRPKALLLNCLKPSFALSSRT